MLALIFLAVLSGLEPSANQVGRPSDSASQLYPPGRVETSWECSWDE